MLPQEKMEAVQKISNLLNHKVSNRQRYCMQVLKQFIYFPDSSTPSSSIRTPFTAPILPFLKRSTLLR